MGWGGQSGKERVETVEGVEGPMLLAVTGQWDGREHLGC